MIISIICANDSMELAFAPGTDAKIIASHKRRISKEMDRKHGVGVVYVHLDEVPFLPLAQGKVEREVDPAPNRKGENFRPTEDEPIKSFLLEGETF